MKDSIHTFLVLGTHIERAEQYLSDYVPQTPLVMVHTKLLHAKTIDLIHRMSYTRYSPYKHIVPLFFAHDRDYVVKKSFTKTASTAQNLILYPDLRTLSQQAAPGLLENPPKGTCIQTSTTSYATKTKQRREISNGLMETIIGTPTSLFQNRKNLQKITLIDAHTRYYKSISSPRYYIPTIVKHLGETLKIEIVYDPPLLEWPDLPPQEH